MTVHATELAVPVTELRELNELNFARFDAKLEQRLAELKAELKSEMAAHFAAADAGLERVRGDVRSEVSAARADLIKWMFVFVATAVLTILSLG